jgi:peptidoglycan/xylan/chitin deacetylase (PgdA/CDA1 family)
MAERADASPRWMVRRAFKVVLARALTAAGAHRVVGALRRGEAGGARVLVVSYHRVTHEFEADAREGLASLLISTSTLEAQLEHLARTREIVSMRDACRILSEPPGAKARRDAVAITFDDGYADVHGLALPILARLRIPATAFVSTGYLGTSRRLPHDRIYAALTELQGRGIPAERAGLPGGVQALLSACAERGPAATLDRLISRLAHDDLEAVAGALAERVGISDGDLPPATRILDWEEVRELAARGIELGGHTVRHAVLPNLPFAAARREIAGCREALEERIGRAPRYFAYPNGYHSPAIRRAVAEHGFEAAVTTEDRENVRGGDLLALRRKMVWENTTLGPLGYSPALATCNLEGVFTALRLARAVAGDREDALADGGVGDGAPGGAGPGGADARAVS